MFLAASSVVVVAIALMRDIGLRKRARNLDELC